MDGKRCLMLYSGPDWQCHACSSRNTASRPDPAVDPHRSHQNLHNIPLQRASALINYL